MSIQLSNNNSSSSQFVRPEQRLHLGTLPAFEERIVLKIASFLEPQEMKRFEQVAFVIRQVLRKGESSQAFPEFTKLAHELTTVAFKQSKMSYPQFLMECSDPVKRQENRALIVRLVASDVFGYCTFWEESMRMLLHRFMPELNYYPSAIHQELVNSLAAADSKVDSSRKFYRFFYSLGCHWNQYKFPKVLTWKLFRIFSFYSQNAGPHATSAAQRVLKIVLQQKANEIQSRQYSSSEGVKYQKVFIFSDEWFGLSNAPGCLGADHAAMPELMLEVLWERIQRLRNACSGQLFEVEILDQSRSVLDTSPVTYPTSHFLSPLVKKITDARIYCDDKEILDRALVERSYYRRSLSKFLMKTYFRPIISSNSTSSPDLSQ